MSPDHASPPTTALIAGASGLVGSAVLLRLLDDPCLQQVHVLVRRPLALKNPKLLQHIVDFAALPDLQQTIGQIDEAYIALGSTIKTAGSKAAFRQIDFDAVVATARAAQAAGCRQVALVSALEASSKSPVFYSRVKGQAEEALRALQFDKLVIARPSLLDGDRRVLGQPHRRGEAWALRLMKMLAGLIPLAYQPITGTVIANALFISMRDADKGLRILKSGEMQTLALQCCKTSKTLDSVQNE